jgi:hypothetical protein
MQDASFLSQSFSAPAHLSTSLLQVTPAKPDAHLHANALTPSAHVPPFWHGDDVHSLSFVAQL